MSTPAPVIEYGAWAPRQAIKVASLATTGLGIWLMASALDFEMRIMVTAAVLALAYFAISAGRTSFEAFIKRDYMIAAFTGAFAIGVTAVCYVISSSGTQQIFTIADDAMEVESGANELAQRKLDTADARVANAKEVLPELKESQRAAVAAVTAAKAETAEADARRLAADACDNAKHRPDDDNPNCQARTAEWGDAKAAEVAAVQSLADADAALKDAQAELTAAEKARADLLGAASGPTAASAVAIVASVADWQRWAVNYVLNLLIDFGSVFSYALTGRLRREEGDKPLTLADLERALAERAPAAAPAPQPQEFRTIPDPTAPPVQRAATAEPMPAAEIADLTYEQRRALVAAHQAEQKAAAKTGDIAERMRMWRLAETRRIEEGADDKARAELHKTPPAAPRVSRKPRLVADNDPKREGGDG